MSDILGAMNPPILKADTEREITLETPRTGAWLAAAALSLVALAIRLLFPAFWIAPAMLMVLAVWTLTGAFQVHRLRLDLERGEYTYRRGFLLAPPRRQGKLAEITGVFIERHEPAGGLAASRLRSRIVTIELDGWPEDGRFVLGFPMGPRIAEEKAADYARRLGSVVGDRTGETSEEVSEL